MSFEKAQRVWHFTFQDPAIFDVSKSLGHFLYLADEQGIEAVILTGPKPRRGPASCAAALILGSALQHGDPRRAALFLRRFEVADRG